MVSILRPPVVNLAILATAVRTESGIADPGCSSPLELLTVVNGTVVIGLPVDVPALIVMVLLAEPVFPAASFALTFIERLPESPSGIVHA